MFTIRQLEKADFEEFQKIFTKVTYEEFPEYTDRTRQYFGNEEYVKQQFDGNIVLGAFNNNTLVGFLVANKPFGGILFIPWIAVLKEYQRKGIGKLLLQEIEKIALDKGAHSIHLETYERDLEYYKHRGYIEYGYDKNSYFGADEYLMKKELQEPKEENYLKY